MSVRRDAFPAALLPHTCPVREYETVCEVSASTHETPKRFASPWPPSTTDAHYISSCLSVHHNRAPTSGPTARTSSTYLKLAAGPYSYLLESVEGARSGPLLDHRPAVPDRAATTGHRRHRRGRRPRWSRSARAPTRWPSSTSSGAAIASPGRWDAALQRRPGGLLRTTTLSATSSPGSHTAQPGPARYPDILLMVSDEVVVFDNLRRASDTSSSTSTPPRAVTLTRAEGRIADLIQLMQRGAPRDSCAARRRGSTRPTSFSGFTEAGFKQAVERNQAVQSWTAICMQVVLSQRLSIPFQARPLDLYPRPAWPQPVALHVLPRPRRLPDRRLVAGDPHPARGTAS